MYVGDVVILVVSLFAIYVVYSYAMAFIEIIKGDLNEKD